MAETNVNGKAQIQRGKIAGQTAVFLIAIAVIAMNIYLAFDNVLWVRICRALK